MRIGDRKVIADKAGVSGVTVWKTLNKCCLTDMTPAERKAWSASLKFMSERQAELEKLGKQTAKLSEKIQ